MIRDIINEMKQKNMMKPIKMILKLKNKPNIGLKQYRFENYLVY